MTKIGKYNVYNTIDENKCDVDMYYDGCYVGSIDNITIEYLDEESIDELFFGEEDELFIEDEY